MKRRAFIVGLGATAACPLATRAQQPALPVIGVLDSERSGDADVRTHNFRTGLGEAGFVEGRNVVIEQRSAGGQYERLPALADELVRRHVSVIAALGANNAALAAKAATTTIPIVFSMGSDPVGLGLVASLNRPGGNVTGATSITIELVPKKLELLHQVVPEAALVGVLVNSANVSAVEAMKAVLEPTARTLGLKLQIEQGNNAQEIDRAFETLSRSRAQALLVGPFAYFNTQIEWLAALSLRYALPAMFQTREFAAAGGLVSYGASPGDSYYWSGLYTGRILKGAKPADLPVVRSSKLELFINLKTAKALSVTVPPTLLATAHGVIE
jgi:putative tryptophan/tyrosine transport system substrate-binding protein